MMNRTQRLQQQLTELNIDGVLITNPENRRYLSGFTGSAGALLISATAALIITDFRYWEQVGQEVKDFVLYKQGPNFWLSVAELVQQLRWEKVGFEAGNLIFQHYQFLQDSLPGKCLFLPSN